MNVDAKIWGGGAWRFLHSVTLRYPYNPTRRDKEKMSGFFNLIKDVLPCDNCRESFRDSMRKYPLNNKRLESQGELVGWLIDVHNYENKKMGKPEMTYQQFKKEYDLEEL